MKDVVIEVKLNYIKRSPNFVDKEMGVVWDRKKKRIFAGQKLSVADNLRFKEYLSELKEMGESYQKQFSAKNSDEC